jgi:hypothetical protein
MLTLDTRMLAYMYTLTLLIHFTRVLFHFKKKVKTIRHNAFRRQRARSQQEHVRFVMEGGRVFYPSQTHQKEQLVSVPFWRKTLRNGLKK